MASLIKVEQSSYVKDVVDTYASNKVSQYSKYLNLTPTFVTYLAVNQIMSRADTGTGTVNSETGYNSPLRFNKIIGLPVYNIPVLSPDILYDETGMNLELDLNDIVLLPDTVKPTVPDYMVIDLPEGTQVLFRVNSFRYNTIQSNEFVSIQLELKDYGKDVLSKFDSQIVKTYYTVFENIGTEDKCFIEEESVGAVNSLVDGINECIDLYQEMYYDKGVGGYLLPNEYDSNQVIYDPFITKFINDLNLFPHSASTLTTMPYLDYNPYGSELKYKRSLLYAIATGSNKFLLDKLYYYLGPVESPASPLNVYGYNALSIKLVMVEKDNKLTDYYDKWVKKCVIYGDSIYPIPLEDKEENDTGEENESYISDISTYSHTIKVPPKKPKPIKSEKKKIILEDFDHTRITNSEKGEPTVEDYETISKYSTSEIYILDTIVKFMAGVLEDINIPILIDALITPCRFSYFYGPIMVRILKSLYDNYFTSTEE